MRFGKYVGCVEGVGVRIQGLVILRSLGFSKP